MNKMNAYRFLLVNAALAALCHVAFAGLAPAMAQVAIGEASVVQNDVSRARKTGTAALPRGADVFQNEVIRVGLDSAARLDLIDSTNISLGASSLLTLDKFVYNGDHTAKNVTMNAVKGSFRFISGDSPSKAYKVNTPEAAIGVRGTVYDVLVESGSTTVVLIEGAAQVCTRQGRGCVNLTQACQSVTVTPGAVGKPVGPEVAKWAFDSKCKSAFNFYRPDQVDPGDKNQPATPPSQPAEPQESPTQRVP